MQVFIPYAELSKNLHYLDNKRLNKQILECKQIIDCINGNGSNYTNNAVVRMYWNYLEFLKIYMAIALVEWVDIRKKNHIYYESIVFNKKNNFFDTDYELTYPHWWNDNKIHDSHKSLLFRKDPVFYKEFADFSGLYDNYVYPSHNADILYKNNLICPEFTDRKYWWLGYYRNVDDTLYSEGLGKKHKPLT